MSFNKKAPHKMTFLWGVSILFKQNDSGVQLAFRAGSNIAIRYFILFKKLGFFLTQFRPIPKLSPKQVLEQGKIS